MNSQILCKGNKKPTILAENGVTFQPFDKESMGTAITMSMTREWNHGEIAARAMERFGAQAHFTALTKEIYRF